MLVEAAGTRGDWSPSLPHRSVVEFFLGEDSKAAVPEPRRTVRVGSPLDDGVIDSRHSTLKFSGAAALPS